MHSDPVVVNNGLNQLTRGTPTGSKGRGNLSVRAQSISIKRESKQTGKVTLYMDLNTYNLHYNYKCIICHVMSCYCMTHVVAISIIWRCLRTGHERFPLRLFGHSPMT